jgi:hypothetical protein
MLREQMINFLQATVIFLLIINAFTITAAVCAIRLLTGTPLEKRQVAGVIERRLELMFPSKSSPGAPGPWREKHAYALVPASQPHRMHPEIRD